MQARIGGRIQSQQLWGAAMLRILNFVVASATVFILQRWNMDFLSKSLQYKTFNNNEVFLRNE